MRLRKLGLGLLALGLVGLIGTTALAQPPGKGKPGGKGKEAGKKDKMKFKGKFGDKGRSYWGKGFGGARGGFAHRGHRGHRGRYAFGPRGYRGRFAGRGHRGHRGRHAWGRGARFGRHAHRGHHGRFGGPRRMGRFGPGWGRPGRGGRFGWGRPGFGRPGFGGRFGGKGFAGKGAFAMGFSRGGLLKSLKLTEEQQKKLADLRKSEAAAIKKAMEARRDEMRKSLKGILTAEQYKKLEEATKRFKSPSRRGTDKGKKDKKPKDDLETSASPVAAARELAAITLPEDSRSTREAVTRFARRE